MINQIKYNRIQSNIFTSLTLDEDTERMRSFYHVDKNRLIILVCQDEEEIQINMSLFQHYFKMVYDSTIHDMFKDYFKLYKGYKFYDWYGNLIYLK